MMGRRRFFGKIGQLGAAIPFVHAALQGRGIMTNPIETANAVNADLVSKLAVINAKLAAIRVCLLSGTARQEVAGIKGVLR